ncbi:MAG: UDP-N-acetylmuramoyl-tripeptide--D-alanyl-D-alanine ligase [Candidatus Omnitrophota bacterium]
MFDSSQIIRSTLGKLVKGKSTFKVEGISTDSRTTRPNELFIPLKGKNFNGHDFIFAAVKAGARAILIEEKFYKKDKNLLDKLQKDTSCIIVSDTLRALGDLAFFFRKRFALPIIAVTGSSGKTTTKEMIAAVLSSRYKVLKNQGTQNNLIGVALNLLKLNPHYEIACFEFGTSSFGEIARLTEITRPSFAIITNIAQAHLEKLKSRAGVLLEKSQLLKGLIPPALALINQDDNYLNRLDSRYNNIFGFGKEKICDFFACDISMDVDGFLRFRLKGNKQIFAIRTLGVHNIYNALASISVGLIFGITGKSIAESLANFEFPPGRFNVIKNRGLTIIDDTYNANPLSFACAIESLKQIRTKGRKFLVLADMLELGHKTRQLHEQLGKTLKQKNFDFLLSLGKLAAMAAKSSINHGFNKNKVFTSQDAYELKDKLSSLLRAGDFVLVKGSRAMQMERIVDFLLKIKVRG